MCDFKSIKEGRVWLHGCELKPLVTTSTRHPLVVSSFASHSLRSVSRVSLTQSDFPVWVKRPKTVNLVWVEWAERYIFLSLLLNSVFYFVYLHFEPSLVTFCKNVKTRCPDDHYKLPEPSVNSHRDTGHWTLNKCNWPDRFCPS